MEDIPLKLRRNSNSQIKLKGMRDSVKFSLSIQPFSAGIRRQDFYNEEAIIENPKENTPEKIIQTKDFFNFYKDIKNLGQGGQSLIKKVKRISDDKFYAVKIYKIKSSDDTESMNSILKEFLNSQALEHQSILKVYEIFADDFKGEVRIVMEYLKLKTLGHLIKKKYQFSEKETSLILYKILNAVCYMHSKGISHRDINPSNIMLDKDFQVVKIIDFGISKNCTEIIRKNRKFIKKSVAMYSSVGTLSYSAPEIFSGEGYTYDVDIWSIGVIAFQMLSQELPFYSEYSGNLIDLISDCKVEFPKYCNISNLAKDFCIKLLRKSSNGRLNAEEAIRHPFILFHNQTKILKEKISRIKPEIPVRKKGLEKLRRQIFRKLELGTLTTYKSDKNKLSNNIKLINSLKKFSITPIKKLPLMKIKNFPPIIFNGNLTKDPETFSLTFKKLNSALSIDDDFDKRSKSKEDLDEIFKSKEDFDDGKKKSSSEKTNYESQNLITSNLL